MPKPKPPAWLNYAREKLEPELVERYGEAQRARIHRGLLQLTQFWRAEDGDLLSLEAFVGAHFAGEPARLDAIFQRFAHLLEQLDGHSQEIAREFRTHADLELGPMLPVDEIFAGYDPAAHISEDLFRNKLAFVVLLNFPLTTLEQRLREGPGWTRRQWAEARLAQRFSKRIPAEVNQAVAQATAAGGNYIAQYNIWMHHLLDEQRRRLFPPQLRLLSHWSLRDQIKADYSDAENGVARQRMIQKVLERIVTQTIPAVVINNPGVDWSPFSNKVQLAAVHDGEAPTLSPELSFKSREPDTRYAVLRQIFLAWRMADPYSPTAPTLMARRFEEDREIPEEQVHKMLVDVVSSPLAQRVANLIVARLGRPLEPFDLWYRGFRPRSPYTEAELDAMVRKKYPSVAAYQADLPDLLARFGWSRQRAKQLADSIVVDPARGSGHALGSAMRSAKMHLRTRVEAGGMNYEGFTVAMHELGHNVEQTVSLQDVDFYFLRGVPNTAFTEALAFVFQARDLEQLGFASAGARDQAAKTLNDFWSTYEIAGVALVDMAVWHWMYQHPKHTPGELRQAVLRLCKDVWNRYYAPIFQRRDVILLGVYSHMIDYFLYLPDYPLGHLIAFQIEEHMRKVCRTNGQGGDAAAGLNLGPEFERMAKFGSLAPDLWMRNATGQSIGPEALLEATREALREMGAGEEC
jgi:hypothetical protein